MMQVRETDRVEDTTYGSDSYSAYWRYYRELEFQLGDGRVVLVEVENDDSGPGKPQIVTIRGVFQGSERKAAGAFYDAAEARDVMAELHARGFTRIQVWNGQYSADVDAARLKDAR